MAARPWGFKSPLPHQLFLLSWPRNNFLLINPWIYDFAAYDFWTKPLGLLYIAAILEAIYVPAGSTSSTAWSARPACSHGRLRSSPTAGAPFPRKRSRSPPCSVAFPRRYSRYGIPVRTLPRGPGPRSRPRPRPRDGRDDLLVSWCPGGRRSGAGEVRSGSRRPRRGLSDAHARPCAPGTRGPTSSSRGRARTGSCPSSGTSSATGSSAERGRIRSRSDAPSGLRSFRRQDLPSPPDVPGLSLSVFFLRESPASSRVSNRGLPSSVIEEIARICRSASGRGISRSMTTPSC